jgi:GT2 family glycosyltransferase
VAGFTGEGPPFVSVIIPVYNDSDRLRLCLELLARQTYPQARFEVLVIDNGSSPPVPGEIAQGNVVLLREPRPGGFIARNVGIEAAKGGLLAFTDADCLPEEDWLASLVKAVPDEGTLVAGPIEAFPLAPLHPTPSERFDMTWGFPQHRFVADGYGASANLAVPRAIFDDVGLYDASLLSDGDQEWCHRALTRGFRIRYTPEARVRHPARNALRQHVTKTRRLTGGMFACAKDGKLPNGRMTLLYNARPPLRRLLHTATARGFGSLADRARIAGILVLLRAVTIAEWIRLELGGSPERR